jgi:hypothetical protein
MRASREAVSVALFNLFATDATLKSLCKTITRTVKMWPDVPDVARPWLMLFKGGPASEGYQQPQNERLGLTKYIISYNLWLYVTSAPPASNVPVETLLNNIADAIDNAMQGPVIQGQPIRNAQTQTLGGLVNNAYIDGGSEWGREFEDQQIVCMWRILVETGM